MKPNLQSLVRVGGATLALTIGLAPSATAQFEKEHSVVDLADGVFAILWENMTSFPVEGNHLVIINATGVVVVDANRTPSLAEEVIAIIRERTSLPVRYVINTHWHADHVQGNAVYRRTFPDVAIVGHPETAAGIDTVLRPYVTEVDDDLARMRGVLASDTLSDERRPRVEAQVTNLEREATLYEVVEFVAPTALVTDSLRLDGSRTIDVLHLGHGNTPGDLVVYLPAEGIVAVGDLVTRPYPLLGWDAPASWSRVLDNVLAREPRMVVPGHGEVLRTTEYAELFRDLFKSLSEQVAEGVAARRSLEDLQSDIDLDRFWREFAGDDDQLFRAFGAQFQPVAVRRAYLELQP